MDGTERIIKKNNALLILLLMIFLIIEIGIGIYIKLEMSNTRLNYNILLNSVLENSRSLFLGLNDGILQLYSCEENIEQKIKTEMTKYLNTIPNIAYSFPFSFCLSNFDFRDITSNIYYDYLSIDIDIWLTNSFSNFSGILENIENCMNNALSYALSQESSFLLEPIIVSKKQMWAIHQKMRNYSINMTNEEFKFGQNTLNCNNSMIHDMEGSPRITGVLINGSEYQAPLFKIDTKLLDKDAMNFANSGNDINSKETEISLDNIIEDARSVQSSKIQLNEIDLIVQKLENNEFPKHVNKIKFLNELFASPQKENFFANISNPRILGVDGVINYSNNYKSAFIRTIYIPTSSLLSIVEVFSEGMKELERNMGNNLVRNIMLIQVFSTIIIIISLVFTAIIFIPLILIESEKGKEIFSNYGFFILERYKYFSRKYSREINCSLGEFYSLFEKLFNVIHKVLEVKKKEKNETKKINKTPILSISKNIELNIVCKQLMGIFKFKLCYVWKFSILNSCCLAVINNQQNEFMAENTNTNLDSILESLSELIDGDSSTVEVVTKINNKSIDNNDYFKLFLYYIVISNLVYSINSIIGKDEKIKLKSEKRSITLSINSEQDIYSLIKHLNFANFINSFDINRKVKDFRECFEEFNIENNLLNILIERLNLEFFIRPNSYELLIDITNKYKSNQMINNSSKNNYLQNEKLGNELAFVLILEGLTPYQNYIIEYECSKININFIRTKYSNLNLISVANMEILVIFANKILIKLDEIIEFVSKIINDQSIIREIVVFWLESDEIILQDLKYQSNSDKKSFESFKLSNSIDKMNCYIAKSSQSAHNLSDNFNSLNTEYVSNIQKSMKAKISQCSLKEPLSHSCIKKLLSNFVPKKTKVDGQFLLANSPLQNFIDIIDNKIHLQLSKINFFANNFIFELNDLNSIDKNFYCDENNYLSNEYTEINNNGVLIKELQLKILRFSMIRSYDLRKYSNQKSKKLDFVNSVSLNGDFNLKDLTNKLLSISESELTCRIRNGAQDILQLLSVDKLPERIDLIMDFWEFIKRNTLIKNEKFLQYYCPKLVLHCILVLEILIKNSIGLIENIVFDSNNVLALIITFISIPFIKPGITSDIISLSNEIIPIYSNKLAPLEIQICSILEKILSFPKFSNLFDDLEVSW
ncbi:hypothetical protein CmeUKMEL1_16470 [Cryptosporidium meleagridis]|uniref:Uncharacterized protein n=1 Tax=Cryptosporidium meleagridis TaxID=93969 RepID=A0A2P4Z5A5_9CRYT|nr:hypothetical protein CmeUKMEL1_16470 [Cryptosporidium meleagridis]